MPVQTKSHVREPQYEPFAASDSPDQRIFNTQIWFALRHGTLQRAGLPEELVAIIARLADLKVPDLKRTVTCRQPVFVDCGYSMERQTRIWFRSPRLTHADVSQIAAAQLVTVSKDQGWTTHPHEGPRSWFEVGVFPADSSDKDTYSPKQEDKWKRSHYNRMAYDAISYLQGTITDFGEDAMEITPGSCVVVRACAEHSMWQNHGQLGELRFWRWFEPVQEVIRKRLERCEGQGGCRHCSPNFGEESTKEGWWKRRSTWLAQATGVLSRVRH